MLEKQFQKTVTNYLRKHDIFFIKTNTGKFYRKVNEQYLPTMMSSKGVSDLIIFKDKTALFVELKTDKNYLSLVQKEFKNKIEEKGFEYIVLKPKNWKEFKNERLNNI